MTQTNMDVLEVACRNKIDPGWFVEMRRIDPAGEIWAEIAAVNCSIRIRAEYYRLMRLKARKKRWRS